MWRTAVLRDESPDLFVVWDRSWAQEPAPGLRLTPAGDQPALRLRWTATW